KLCPRTNLYSLSPLTLPYIHSFFFNNSANTEIYTLSLHDALPISCRGACVSSGAIRLAASRPNLCPQACTTICGWGRRQPQIVVDRKSTRLNSSHVAISYAVFCLKKKKRYVA